MGVQHFAYSQLAQSPYTLIGIGDLNTKGLAHNMGMGGVGIAVPTRFNINNINPALLALNQFATFEVGFTGENRIVETSKLYQKSGGISLGYLVFSFPIVSGKWSSSFGLMPYSYVNYDVKDRQDVIGTDGELGFSFRGRGGMNTLYWSNGFLLFKKLALGAKISHYFGSIIDETVLQIVEETNAVGYNSALYERTEFSDFNYELGASYRFRFIGDTYLSLGAIYENGADIRSFRHERLERRTQDDFTVQIDTIMHDYEGSIYLPPNIGVGISLAKDLNWMIGMDFSTRDWSLYEDFDGKSDLLTQSYKGAIGLEFIPDIQSISSYLSRLVYRVGFSYEQTPYIVNDIKIEQFGINFGISLPVSRASLLNLGFQYGQRGQIENGLIKESYYRMTLGISFNDRWFLRRKID